MEIFDKDIQLKYERRKFKWRLFGLICLSYFLINDLVLIISNMGIMELPFQFTLATDRLSFYYAYFTTQTNYLVWLYLFFMLFESRFNKNKDKNNSSYIFLAITVYITITMMVFWLGLFLDFSNKIKFYSEPYNGFKTIIMHLIMPIVFIVCFCKNAGKEKYSIKNHHKMYLWFINLYPVSYLIYVLIRGTLCYQQGQGEASYPYPFLNYEDHGVLFLVLAVLAILFLVIGLQYFYMWINNRVYNKKEN